MSDASQRAAMPSGTHTVLDRRNVHNANRNLLNIVKPGDTVLDVGCGAGSITAGIAELTGAGGQVTGIDTSQELINRARENFSHLDNMHFEVADINTYQPQKQFNVITTARVLQWVDNPAQLINRMVQLLEKDGHITILDYNHERIQWSPAIPASMQQFYQAFLQWRADAGMDNQIADHLAGLLTQQGLTVVRMEDLSEKAVKGEPGFREDLDIWAKVAETRGQQLVKDGYITEDLRLKAIAEYRSWIDTGAETMTLYLLALTARR
ncbi:class I SAM-dependent methyltransferase [Chitinophaga agrisoli]|uniref:Class I SAM-dependent methyltransferase n=1 Tax=Chitinophaga agrisoli TaxID=2607653 RepID=A0A5B2VQP8_9BACT|nr:class I SAM-dependent methyltransferase [Chitinophaga agrisoli]KAA2240706.1 class I SAM-dependent methyltransferase [Chitinophaga agrisoli]